ncbi:hypothetical protein FKW77_000074 [Venturia effusa]|uniref:Queuine tRNA-ribosyltransferase accessory subunit 2 n=1 Tax=Venturia effusa TaxID=50376 RepID=A0A517KYT9_9PEZI|nr:hypothetical protein FKW77_000074 [Venturia effusa]
MAEFELDKLSFLPEEMIAFTLSSMSRSGPRLGQLALRGRATIKTPHYIANTSRGVVPHVSQDNLTKYCNINGLYVGLEDFVEKQPPKIPPIFTAEPRNGESRLRNFTGHDHGTFLILGPRRFPPVDMPLTNTNSNKSLAICTSVGFRSMDVEFYIEAARRLRPDIVLAPGDFGAGGRPSVKRADKMGDRTTLWIREIMAEKEKGGDMTVFAPILSVPLEQQKWYLDMVVDECSDRIEGLYVQNVDSVLDLPDTLKTLPRLAFTNPEGPEELLRQISLGVDLFVLPFIAKATDGGVALDFVFPPPTDAEDITRKAIGIDIWNDELATDVSPLQADCKCYACTKHHRAYVHHLLRAKEMLAWVLLQLHNHHVLDQFFNGVRASIEKDNFEDDRAAFQKFYLSDLPVSNGLGPRTRGYQTKSMSSGESKKNPKAYNNLDHMAKGLKNNMANGLEDIATSGGDIGAGELEELAADELAKSWPMGNREGLGKCQERARFSSQTVYVRRARVLVNRPMAHGDHCGGTAVKQKWMIILVVSMFPANSMASLDIVAAVRRCDNVQTSSEKHVTVTEVLLLSLVAVHFTGSCVTMLISTTRRPARVFSQTSVVTVTGFLVKSVFDCLMKKAPSQGH